MRHGFTTGSCSAAAAKAAAYMLLGGKRKENIDIITMKGIVYHASIVDIHICEKSVSCAVIKDAGDDPDVTNGAHICACVEYEKGEAFHVSIDGGEGVGVVTRPGLDQAVSRAAINSVPRLMIENEVKEVMRLFDYDGALKVTISVPNGRELAEKTFNKRLGIEGGISILGTSGIVEPMSMKALTDTIKVELSQKRAMGCENICITPGNYGLDFMDRTFNYNLEYAVKCSNFIGQTIDMAAELGFSQILLCGHIGKLVKVAGGMMNTHSSEGDCRMEVLSSAATIKGADKDLACKIMDCLTTQEALGIIEKNGILEKVMEYVGQGIDFHLKKRAAGRIGIEFIVYSNEQGLLYMSSKAKDLLGSIMEDL